MTEYSTSQVIETWQRNNCRYRRLITRDGRTVIERGVDGRYTLDYIR